MKQYIFSDFKYELSFTPTKQHRCVTVTFLCDDQLIKRPLFILEKEGTDYVKEAKRIINRDQSNGDLIRYVDKYNRKNTRPLWKTIVVIFAIIALFCAVLLICDYLVWGGGELFA